MSTQTDVAPILQIHPARRCNLACKHCYTTSGPWEDDYVDASTLKLCFEDAWSLGYRQLSISGGEPLLYNQLEEILRHARRLGFINSVTTNGMFFGTTRWKSVHHLVDVLAVSLEGPEALHDEMRGKGTYRKVINGLELLRAQGNRFAVIFTLTQHNANCLEYVTNVASQHGAIGVQVHALSAKGRAAEYLPGDEPDGLEGLVALLEASRLSETFRIPIHVDLSTLDQLNSFKDRFVPPVSTLLANVVPILIVTAGADVIPMTHNLDRRFWLGNLNRQRLSLCSRDWINSAKPDRLMQLCESTWNSLTGAQIMTSDWYNDLANTSKEFAY